MRDRRRQFQLRQDKNGAVSSSSEKTQIRVRPSVSLAAKPGILRLERGDACLEYIDGGSDILDKQHLRDVLRTVRVPCLDGEQDRGLGARAIVLREQTRD